MAVGLVVDDSRSVRQWFRIALEQLGHDVIEARDGEEALNLYSQNSTDFVVTDIEMPGKTGLELIADLRRANPSVKILAVSGMGGAVLQRSVELGAVSSLSKPCSLQEVRDAIQGLLA